MHAHSRALNTKATEKYRNDARMFLAADTNAEIQVSQVKLEFKNIQYEKIQMESLQQAENIRIPVRLTPEELKEKELQYMVSKANNDIKADGLENIPDVVVVPVW